MLKLKIGIVGEPDKKDLEYIKAKILENFPPIKEVEFIHLSEDYQRWIIYMFKKISLITFFISDEYEKQALSKFRDDFAKESDCLACLLFFMKRSLRLDFVGWADPPKRTACAHITKSPRTSKSHLCLILHELGHLFDLGDIGFAYEGDKYVHSGPCVMTGSLIGHKYDSEEFCSYCKKRIARFK